MGHLPLGYEKYIPRPLVKRANIFFYYFLTNTYVVGTQKNRLDDTVLLSTRNIMIRLMGKKIFTILHSKFCLTKRMYYLGLFTSRKK